MALLIGRVGTAAAGTDHWVHDHYGSVDGLPVDSATDAAVDTEGFLWLATHDGLARFDGERFEVYDSMHYPAMSGNRVRSLFKDTAGRLYALTEHGDWLALRGGQVERIRLGDSRTPRVRSVDPDSLCVTTASALFCPDGKGVFQREVGFPPGVDAFLALRGAGQTVWLLSRERDVWYYRQGRWQALWKAGSEQGRVPPAYAIVDDAGNLWTEIRDRLLELRPDGTQHYHAGQNAPQEVIQLRRGRGGRVWVGAGNGVFHIDAGRVHALPDVPPGVGDSAAASLSWSAPDGALWVARAGQLWRLANADAPGQAIQVLDSGGTIQNLLFGPGQLVWVMTLRDGVYRLNRPRVDLLGVDDGLPGGNVYSVARGTDGRMWLGMLDHGLAAVDAEDHIQRFGTADGLPGPNPWLVASAGDGTLYVATYAPGLWRKRADEKRFSAVPLPAALQRDTVRAVVFDGSGQPCIGTSDGAWCRRNGQWQRFWPLSSERVRVGAMVFRKEGTWLGTDQGVWFVHGRNQYPVAARQLAQTTIRDLYFARDGALWISTVGRGLLRVDASDPRGQHALQLGREQGLPSNSPHAVQEDASGNFWVNSNQGIFRIAGNDLQAMLAHRERTVSPLQLGLSDGLTELEGNGGVQPASAWDASGRLWFPSQGGVVRFNPEDVRLHEQPPTPAITGIESEARAVTLDTAANLPVGVRSVRIRYVAANLAGNGQSRFRYRLLPVTRSWTEALTERSAFFASLPAGDYQFELLAANSDGVWSTTPVRLDFRVPAYWYEANSVRLLVLAVLLLGVGLLLRWRLHRLHQRARLLDARVRERTDQFRAEKDRAETAVAGLGRANQALESSNLRLANQSQKLEQLDRFRTRLLADVSHELRTPVMLVSLPLADLAADADTLSARGRERLSLAARQLDRLRGLVEQLVGLVQAESGQMPLRLQRLDLLGVLDSMARDYQLKAAAMDVTVSLETTLDTLALYADRAHLATLFGNLLDNAIKHAPAASAVLVRVERTEAQAVVTVSDHGAGFDPQIAARLFERFFRADGPPRHGREGLGIGLSLARELVELHGGRIRAESTPGQGARFIVELPLGSEHVALDELDLNSPASALASVAPVQERSSHGSLLLVEDHPELAAYLGERLREQVPTRVAGSAEAARDILLRDDEDIRLLVVDVVLPGASGIELCRALQQADPPQRRPVILISAKATVGDREAGLAAGAVAYLTKPFSMDALLHAVAAAWPALAPRLVHSGAQLDSIDPLLQLAEAALADAGFGVTVWAAAVHLSERQLRRRVTDLTAQSPQAWLRERRLQRVRELIKSGACKTLAEAGARCGLDNPSYLYRSYRARFGDD
ncbi:MAG TPA: ATP-binding protein [Rhodanobacteraceae bacterium]|nr:ATP-binding protein [Rhodanobacteraceae bacterium]